MDSPRSPLREGFSHVPERWRFFQQFSLGQLQIWTG